MSDFAIVATGLTAGNDPTYVAAAQGSRFRLEDGRELVDASNTAAPLGHQHPRLVEAVKRAATSPALNEGWDSRQRDRAARALFETALEGLEDWFGGVRFFLSASEANDQALALAQAITGRTPLVTRERAYHGIVGLSRDVTIQPHWHGGLSSTDGGVAEVPRTTEVRALPAPICRVAAPCSAEGCSCVEEALGLLDGAAAVILDYSQGGIYPAPAYEDAVARAARQAGALWIADEVVSGLGRQGRWLTFTRGDELPDMITLGKGLAGGIAPAAAVILSRPLMDELNTSTWRSYSTFRTHPISMAALAANLQTIAEEQLVERAEANDALFRDGLAEVAADHPGVRSVDGLGMHWTVELHGPDWRDWRATEPGAPLATRVAARAAEAGALISTSGEQTSLFIAPALNTPRIDIDAIFTALDSGLEVADQELVAGEST